MQELNEQELEVVSGGAWSFPTSFGGSTGTNTSSAGTTATSSASGQHGAAASQASQSVTIGVPIPGTPSASFSLGFATGIAL